MDRLALPDVLAQLRKDLLDAHRAGEGEQVRFLTDDVEIELQLVATKDAEAKTGVKFWVINADAGASISQAVTQKVKLKLKALGADGRPLLVSDADERKR